MNYSICDTKESSTKIHYGRRDQPHGEIAGFFELIESLAKPRLAGKELNPRRPSLAVRIPTTTEGIVVAKPMLSSGPTGWSLADYVDAQVLCDSTPFKAKARFFPTGEWKARCWFKDRAKSDKAFGLLVETVEAFVTDPAATLAHSTHCAICGKFISDEVSQARGIGPDCIDKFPYDSSLFLASTPKAEFNSRHPRKTAFATLGQAAKEESAGLRESLLSLISCVNIGV